MIRTLTGKNTYKLRAFLKEITACYVQEVGELGIERLDASEVDVDTILQAVQSLPFLVDKKLVIITSISQNSALLERLEELVDRTAEQVEVLLIDPALDKRKSSYKILQKQTDVHDFVESNVRDLPAWVIEYCTEQGGVISRADANYLVERIGANQDMLARELEKLVLFEPKVERRTIELLTDRTLQSTIFELLDAAFAGNRERAITLYREQRDSRIEPQYILAMLVWQLHGLALAAYAPDTQERTLVEAGLSPYSAKKVSRLAQSLTKQGVKQMIVAITELDLQIKTSADADAGIELFLLSL
jgi:DNA polymerase-3 subunit delta